MAHPALSTLEDLISIQSVNPALEDGAHGEAEVAAYVEERCRRAGLKVSRQPVTDGRENLLIELRGDKPRPTLLFQTHMDTVSLGSMEDPLVPTIRDGRLYGRGACDAKGCLATMLCAIEQAAGHRDELSCDIVLSAAVDEEHRFRGVMKLLEAEIHFDGAVVGEPTELRIVVAHKGVCRFAIETHGKAAHSSVPDEGDSAIMQMNRVLNHIAQAVEPELKSMSHPLCGEATIVVGTVRGGTQINIVPESCRIEIDRRVLPGESSRKVLNEFEARVRAATAGAGVKLSVTELLLDEPLDTNSGATVVTAARNVSKKLEMNSAPCGVAYGSDASKLQAYGGIPTIVFGPGSIRQAHSREEYVSIDELGRATDFYLELMRSFGRSTP